MSALTTAPTTEVIAGFHSLSDPLRLKVLDLLRSQEFCVCELCDVLNLAQFLILEEYLSIYRRFSPLNPARICSESVG